MHFSSVQQTSKTKDKEPVAKTGAKCVLRKKSVLLGWKERKFRGNVASIQQAPKSQWRLCAGQRWSKSRALNNGLQTFIQTQITKRVSSVQTPVSFP